MRFKGKMYYSISLEYIVNGYNTKNSYSRISYFSKNVENYDKFSIMIGNRFAIYRHIDNNYDVDREIPVFEPHYRRAKASIAQYKNQQYQAPYMEIHFEPEIFLKPSRPKTRFIDDNNEIKVIVEETFELMMKEKMPSSVTINVLPFNEFKLLHSAFGSWSNGILGFSINGEKKIFVRENHLDVLMLVIGHEIGHVLTETLPNRHDEEAKAFAFSIEWAKTIKQHNVANLGHNIKDEFDFQPARNGLHDVAFSFVDFVVRKGRKAMQLHDDLVKKYVSVFDSLRYF